MVSMTTMTTTFLGGSAATLSKPPLPATTNSSRRALAIRACSNSSESEKVAIKSLHDGRRDLVFSALAAAASISFAKIVLADEEPKRGTPEAKKKYGPVCVTMPTARICRN